MGGLGMDQWRRQLCVFGLAVIFFMQSCTSVNYSVPASINVARVNSIISEKSYSAQLTVDSAPTKFDEKGVYKGILSAFKDAGLKPSGPGGSDYTLLIHFQAGDDPGGFMWAVNLVTSIITLFIVPMVIPANYLAEVHIKDNNDVVEISEFRVPVNAKTCIGSTPLAYLCVPTSPVSMGRELGKQIATHVQHTHL
jgi:hypothetical protein